MELLKLMGQTIDKSLEVCYGDVGKLNLRKGDNPMAQTKHGSPQTIPETVVGARLYGDLATWFEDYHWTNRLSPSKLVRAALEEYREHHNGHEGDASAAAKKEQSR